MNGVKKFFGSLWTIFVFVGLGDLGGAQGIESKGERPFTSTKEVLEVSKEIGFNLLNSVIGRTGGEERDISVNFTVVGGVCAVVHTTLVPLRFGIEKGGIYEDKWQTIAPVCATDVLMGLLGGHVTGLVCRGWLSGYELRARTYFKGFAAGLLGAVVWGTGTSAAWIIATREYPDSEERKEHDILFYGTVGAGVLLTCISQGVMGLISR